MGCLTVIASRGVFQGPLFRSRLLDLPFDNYFVHNSVFFRFFPAHKEVSISVLLNLIQGLTGVMSEYFIELLSHSQYLFSLDLNICGLALERTQRLMNENTGVRQ